MEYVDYTLIEFMRFYNNKLPSNLKKSIINQIIEGFRYIHNKDLLHRDISYTNILIKKYDHVFIVKISDFGYVKTKQSNLTRTKTEFKGSLNDPLLYDIGFKNYNIKFETYALTKLIYYILTGRNSIGMNNEAAYEFASKGTSSNIKERYKSIDNMQETLRRLKLI